MSTNYVKAKEKVGLETANDIEAQLEKLCLYVKKANNVNQVFREIRIIRRNIVYRIGENIVDGQYIKI